MISQYANSPVYVKLYNGLMDLFSNAQTLEDWYNVVFNLKTAQGFGLDIWGVILNQGRLLNYKNPKLIDISLKNGQITIRSGSVLCVPNGANFRNSVLPRDFTSDVSLSGTNKYYVFYSNGNVVLYNDEDIYSGSTAPSTINEGGIWYDTTNNLIKITNDWGETWTSGVNSFPVGKVSVVDDEIVSIDTIFNGFGYMAETLFVLPGISGYVPDGLDQEGQKKNDYFEINEVVLYQNTATLGTRQYLYFNSSTGTLGLIDNYFESGVEPSVYPCLWFDTANNLMKIKMLQSDEWTEIPASMMVEVFGDETSDVPASISISDLYTQKEESIYLQGAQVIDGVAYTDKQIEDLYRDVLFLKAMSNITNATMRSLNDMFSEFFNKQIFVYEYDVMKLRCVVRFFATKIQKAILTNLLPKPTGVLMGFEFLQAQEYFGFNVAGLPADEQPYAPADQKPFYW